MESKLPYYDPRKIVLEGGKHARYTMAVGRATRRRYRIDAYAYHLMQCSSLH